MPPLHLRLFSWFDVHPAAHWLVAWGAFALLLAAVLAPLAAAGPSPTRRPRGLRILGSTPLFIVAVLLVFAAFRWPAWFTGPLENPDEAEWIACALTLREGGLPWKTIDCHTSGPLNAYTLLLTGPLGLPLDYVGARVLATLLQAAAVLACWGAARRFFPEWIARLAILPAVNLWACRWFHDFVQYSSEMPSVLLLALAGWSGACALTTARPRLRLVLLGAAGALTTAAPVLAKLQSAPLAGTLGLLLLGALWWSSAPSTANEPTRRDRVRGTIVLALGAAAPVVALYSYLWLYGLLAQFRIFYLQSNALYAATRLFAWRDSPEGLLTILIQFPGGASTVLGALAFGLLAAVPAWTVAKGRMLGAALLTIASVVTILAPGRYAQHYLHFLALPLAWLSAVTLAGAYARQTLSAPPRRTSSLWLAAAFLLVTTVWPVAQTDVRLRPLIGYLSIWRQRQVGPVAAQLRALAAPGDKLVVWGWAPGIHVESGLCLGARDAQSERMLIPGPLQSHYRDRLLFDLRRNQPRWFVDAVAPGRFGFQDRSQYGHETWSPLRDYIAAGYERVAEIDGVRVFRRKN